MDERIVLCLELETVAVESSQPLREGLFQKGIRFRSLGEEQARHPETWLARFAEMDNSGRGLPGASSPTMGSG